jgi:hypothetical protein
LADAATRQPGFNLFDNEGLKLVLDAEPHPLAPGGRRRRWTDGTMAGDQLVLVMALAHNLLEHASRAKALYLIEWRIYNSGSTGTKSGLKKTWSLYRNVAHLWAAFNLRHQSFQRMEWCGYTEYHDLCRFLIEAETIRKWAAGFRSSPTARPLLDDAAWRLPAQFAAPPDNPEWPPTGRICLPGIAAWMVQLLQRYPEPPPSRQAGRRKR